MKLLHIHKQSWFPYVVIGLTLALILFMVSAMSGSAPAPSTSSDVSEQKPVVTDEDYRTSIRTVLAEYQDSLAGVQTEADRLALVERTLDRVLSLRVSSGYREMHLEIATSLYQMMEGLNGQEGMFASGEQRLEQVLSQNPWLR